MNDQNTKQIIIERVFDAPRDLVWKAWTDPEMIKKWWGPEHFYAPSITVDLRVGGKYVYCMHGPKDTQFDVDMYSAGVIAEIVPTEKLVVTDYFSDKDGNKVAPKSMGMPEGMPDEMLVTVLFETVEDGKTKLSIIYTPQSEEQYNAMNQSGMKEGWSTSLDKMAKVLAEAK